MNNQNNVNPIQTAKQQSEKTSADSNPKLRLLKEILITYAIALGLLLLGGFISGIILDVIYMAAGIELEDHPLLYTINSYLNFFGIWMVYTVLILKKRETEKYAEKMLGKITPKAWLMLILGFFAVGGMNLLCITGAILNKDIFLYFNKFELLPLIILLLSVFIQSSAEEIACRGFIYRRIEAHSNNPVVPIVVNALFFALLHLTNTGVTVLSLLNIFLSGVFFSLIVYYTNSMAFAFAGHTGWNFCQSIVFGLPNSGNVFPYSVLKLEASNARDSFFYNCGFGVEGTVFSVIVLIVGCLIVYFLGKKGIIGKDKTNSK